MKLVFTFALLASAGLMIPAATQAQEPAATRAIVTDVALQAGGMLQGQVVDKQGQPLANTDVVVSYEGTPIATVQSDAQGNFAVQDLRGGVHAIQTDDGANIYRFWAPQTAPPAAANRVLFVNNGVTQRGQLIPTLTFTQVAVAGGAIGGGYLIYDEVINDDDSGS